MGIGSRLCRAGAWFLAFAGGAAAAHAQAPSDGHALADRSQPGLHASLVWRTADAASAAQLVERLDGAKGPDGWARWSQATGGRASTRASGRDVELAIECPQEAFASALDDAFAATVEAGRDAPRGWLPSELPAFQSGPERNVALGTDGDHREAKPRAWRFHASVLAPAADHEAVGRVLAGLESRLAERGVEVGRIMSPRPWSGPSVLVESSATRPSEARWIPPSDLIVPPNPAEQAGWGIVLAQLADSLDGWTYVPACVDLQGRTEAQHLYAHGDVTTLERRMAQLRTELASAAELDPARLRRWRDAGLLFARAQLAREDFRLRAMHGNHLMAFEAHARALEALPAGAVLPVSLAAPGGWRIVGPPEAWIARLGEFGGEVRTVRASAPSELDALAERDLERMWRALGGAAKYRDLARLRVLSSLASEDGATRSGVEQWIDFEGGRFALAQAVGTTETVVVVTAARGWILGSAAGEDLPPEQANKLRARQERTLFAVLRALAQPERGGLSVRRPAERLELSALGRPLCWLELDGQGLPARAGYVLDGDPTESLYEFLDWHLDGVLPYPLRTRQVDRQAVSEVSAIQVNASLDPALWARD